ncbi:MAG: nuclear transport factor 2 family protein [Terracidiphilus sp.]
MNEEMEAKIIAAEEQLRIAMLNSDLRALDELLAPELIFTNHLGQRLGKKDDLDAYQSGLVKVQELTPSERHIQLHENMAVVSVRMRLSGSYNGSTANGDFRFTRVWSAVAGESRWHIVAAHASLVS